MATIEEQIKEIEDEIFNTQKNKATEHHIGKLKAKIAKLRAQQELNRTKAVGGGKGYYIKKSGDQDLSHLLDFYKCYRAYVRGKVESFRLNDPHIPGKEKKEALKRAQKYFDLACRYAQRFK